jgi:hypothetical protein
MANAIFIDSRTKADLTVTPDGRLRVDTVVAEYPDQTGNAGKVLSTDGVAPLWVDPVSATPYLAYATFADLPASPATDSVAVVLAATGVYFVNRRAAGMYRYDGVDWNYLGPIPEDYFNDSVMEMYDNADLTKRAKFELSLITTATTRTLSIPDKNGTIALLDDLPPGPATISLTYNPDGTLATAGSRTLSYSGGRLVEVAAPGITKTLGYTGDQLTSVTVT